MNDEFSKWVTFPTRWADQDSVGHVNSATFFTYFEIARMAYFEAIDLPRLKVPGKWGPVVVSQTCNYRKQVFHPSEIKVGVRCAELGDRSCRIEYAMFANGAASPSADGCTIMTWLDFAANKSVAFPEVLCDAIRRVEGKAL